MDEFVPVSGNMPGYLSLPSYMDFENSGNPEEPLVSEFVSPNHPITARDNILKAAKVMRFRKALLKRDELSPEGKRAFNVLVLLILSIAVVVTAKVLESTHSKIWLVALWLLLFSALSIAYFLIFYQ